MTDDERAALDQARHERDLAALAAERTRVAKMEATGWMIAPDGSWIRVSVWRAHMRKLARRNV